MASPETGSDSTKVRVPAKSGGNIPERFRASLVIVTGYAEGMEYPLIKACTVLGRDKTADIPVKDALVSRQHAAIQYEEGRFLLKDMGSTNGTLLNGALIETALIRNKDRFSIGDTIIQFIVEETAEGKVFEIR